MQQQEAFEVHNKLNPLLWGDDNKLLPEVKIKLLEVVNQFISETELQIDVLDLLIVGSNASYNYHSGSDIDLHIITNFETQDASNEIINLLYNQLKSSFNSKYDIQIHGLEVEIYIEDVRTSVVSNGIYSVLHDKWIKFPKKLTEVPKIDVSDAFNAWKERIGYAIRSENTQNIKSIIDTLYVIRKNSISANGEYGKGNQLFKDIRNAGLLDQLKQAYYDAKSKELSLESLQEEVITEASKNEILTKSKSTSKGLQRYKSRVKSKIIASNNQYNAIDMNKLFKDNILTVDLDVQGESDTYTVKISFGGFLDILYDQLKREKGADLVDLKMVTRALITGFNRNDVYIKCNCPDSEFRFDYWQTKNHIISGRGQNVFPAETNPNDDKGGACKHVLLVLSNTSWILKCANVIYNYIRYMERNYSKLYQEIIYPAIYRKEFVEEIAPEPEEVEEETLEEIPQDQSEQSDETPQQ